MFLEDYLPSLILHTLQITSLETLDRICCLRCFPEHGLGAVN